LGRDGPVTMWEHHDELGLKMEIRMDDRVAKISALVPNDRHILRHALVGEAGFVEWSLSCKVFLVTAVGHAQRSDLPP